MDCNLQRAMASSRARAPVLSQVILAAGKEVSDAVIDGEEAFGNDDAAGVRTTWIGILSQLFPLLLSLLFEEMVGGNSHVA